MRIVLVLVCLLVMGCDGINNSSSSTGLINIAGSWTFTAKSANLPTFGNQLSASGTVDQTGSMISGSLALVGTPCATSGVMSGTLSGNSIAMTVNEGSQAVIFTGTVNSSGSSASGSYSAPVGGCTNDDNGTWIGSKGSVTGAFRGQIEANNALAVDIIAELQEEKGAVTGSAQAVNSICPGSIGIRGNVSGIDISLSGVNENGETIAAFAGKVDDGGNILRLNVSGGCPYTGTLVLNRLAR